ncbi:MAG TPA: hypothetical protein VNU72_12695, partial [Puia sp.]|nr:hypothetical protein [Puia sp.]
IRSRFDEFRSRAVEEKLFVHTDRPYYFAGEIIWCKVYCVDGSTHRPLDISKIVYVELLNRENKPVLQAKIGMANAEGKGTLYLPVSLTSGYYKLRAYTNWMKNFGADYYYEQIVAVVNTLKPVAVETPAAPGPETAPIALSFFPEGGNLVNGIASKLAFRMMGPDGNGRDYRGVVVVEGGDTVARFRPLRFGIGSFSFTPMRGHRYKARVEIAGGPALEKELPEALDKGYVLAVTDASDGRVKVSVHAGGTSGDIYLFGQCRQQPFVTEGKVLSGDSAVFFLDKDRLGQGINQLTLFDGSMRPVCERLYFKRPSQRLVIRATMDSTRFGTRSLVNLGITTGGEAGGYLPASLSLSVYRVDSLMSETAPAGMYDYLWLGSDLRGRIESPEYYFSAVGADADAALDNLMLTHGWRRWKWETVMSGKQPVYMYPPELSGQLITGRLTDPKTGMAVVNRNCFLSTPGENFRWGVGRTDSSGRFVFDIKDFYGPGGILVQSGLEDDSACRVDINSPFSEQVSDWRPPLFRVPAEWQTGGLRAALKRRSISMQVQNIYLGDSLQKFHEQQGDSLSFFGKPEFSYKLDDYTRFTTIEEVLREYVREINVRLSHGKLHLVMVDVPNRQLFEDRNTLVLLDGVPVIADRIFSYDPLKVKRLDIMPRQYYMGSAIFSGIASFSTYKGNYEGVETDARTVFLDYEGLQWEREFYSPEYGSDEAVHGRMPDFRSLLYWNGDLHTDGHSAQGLHFYTSDLPGKYLVLVQGISPDGRAGSQLIGFEVK